MDQARQAFNAGHQTWRARDYPSFVLQMAFSLARELVHRFIALLAGYEKYDTPPASPTCSKDEVVNAKPWGDSGTQWEREVTGGPVLAVQDSTDPGGPEDITPSHRSGAVWVDHGGTMRRVNLDKLMPWLESGEGGTYACWLLLRHLSLSPKSC